MLRIILVLIVAITLLAFFLLVYYRETTPAGKELEEVLEEIKKQGIKPVPRSKIPLKGKAFWVWGTTVREYGVDHVIEKALSVGAKHIFLLVRGTSGEVVKEVIKELLPKAHEKGMYVHAWIVCFSSESPESYVYRKYLLKVILEFLLLNSSGHFVDGIHLDYIRYGGFAREKWQYVSSFVKEVRILIDTVAPNTVLSIASKAENYNSKQDLLDSALFYGQNYTDLAKYVDLFCPMTYYLDYNVPPEAIGPAIKWIKEVTGKSVFAGVQIYPGPNYREPTPDEIKRCIKAAIENGADGVIFFRLGAVLDDWNKYSDALKYSP